MFCKKCKALLKEDYKFCPSCGKENSPPAKPKSRRPKGSGCVSKLQGNRQRPYRAIKNGVLLGMFASEKEASLCLMQHEHVTVTKLNQITLEQLWEKYQTTERYTKLSRDAKNNYNSAWSRLAHLAGSKIIDLKALEYQSCVDKVKEQGLGRDTCEKVRSLISVLCQYAIKLEVIQKNYADTLELPQKSAKLQKRNFTYEEILTLFYNDHDETAKIILCLIYSGVRENELFNMKKENVNLEKRYMVGGSKTEAGKDRVIPIRNEIIDYVAWFNQNSVGDYLVATPNGKKVNRDNFIKRKYYPLLDRLKINYKNDSGQNILTPYRTRHTFIAENIKAGVRPEILTKIVGHANYSTSVDKYDEYFDIDYILSQTQAGM